MVSTVFNVCIVDLDTQCDSTVALANFAASDIPPDRIETRSWDLTYPAKLDLLRGKRTGRLLEYNPKTNQVSVLARGLWFPKGVAVDKDESFVLLSEKFALRMVKYHLNGPQKGTIDTLVESHNMTGYPDGADCAPAADKNSKCYAAIAAPLDPIAKFINMIPFPFDVLVRNQVMALPKWAAPGVKPYGGIMEVDLKTKAVQYFQDPDATDIGHLAGVTVWKNKLYLGSLSNNFVGVYELN
jgi:Strictosidine synthase